MGHAGWQEVPPAGSTVRTNDCHFHQISWRWLLDDWCGGSLVEDDPCDESLAEAMSPLSGLNCGATRASSRRPTNEATRYGVKPQAPPREGGGGAQLGVRKRSWWQTSDAPRRIRTIGVYRCPHTISLNGSVGTIMHCEQGLFDRAYNAS